MGDKSLYLKNQVLNAVLVPGNSLTGSGTGNQVWISLHSGSALSGGNFDATTEIDSLDVTPSGYQRQYVTFASASGGQTGNSADVTFGIASGAYGVTGYVTHFALCSHNTSSAPGHVVFYADALVTPQLITLGNEAKFVSGSITVTES